VARSARDLRRRTLSQNFLRDASAAEEFLRALTLDPDRPCLEVGAGTGVLTERLAGSCRALVAYEIDEELARTLTARLAGRPNVRVVAGDFLAAAPPAQPFQVVGNVPFSLTSRIVDWCLGAPAMTAATIIAQLEYAKKRTGAYGRWSLRTVSTWPDVTWELRGTIARTRFRPVPRVDAGILHIARRDEPLVPPARRAAYARVVELGFGGVGGSVQASLGRRYPASRVARACQAAGLDRSTIVAFVSPEQWLRLFAALD
jgi:23S rRNA (adenine-N6)-dimethyltransferase